MDIKPIVLLVAAMDTKGREALFLKDCLERAAVEVWVMDFGIRGRSPTPVRITRESVAQAGGSTLAEVQTLKQEGRALDIMAQGARLLAMEVGGELSGIIGLGGSMGTTLATAVMRAFPVGFPKMMISTMASRDTRAFVGTKDICMLHSVSDLAGLNRITRAVLRNGANALAGMSKAVYLDKTETRPCVALSTLGTTEACAAELRRLLDDRGWEVVTFHTVGAGGAAMEEMIREGQVQAVLDLSLHELADHLFGGDYDAGPERGRAAVARGLPLVLVPGNVDFLVTGPLAGAVDRFPGRSYHVHNAAITCIRTSREEMCVLAETTADLANRATGPVAVVMPGKGFSAFDHPDFGPMPDEAAVGLFLETVENRLKPTVPVRVAPYHINDTEFASILAETLQDLWSA